MKHCTRGFGKLILFGEHVAVYGSPALGIRLPCHLQLSLAKKVNPDGRMEKLENHSREEDQSVIETLLEIARHEGIDTSFLNTIVQWKIHSTVPQIGGFGSSAALCVAMSRLLLHYDGEVYSQEVHRLANILEGYFHGHPSGIDTGLSSYPGLTAWYAKENDIPEPAIVTLPTIHLVYGALPRTLSTHGSVAAIKQGYNSGEINTISTLQKIQSLSEDFIDLLQKGELKEKDHFSLFVETTRKVQMLLHKLGLDSHNLKKVLKAAESLGAVAGKMSGGGMGGAFFLVVPDAMVQMNIINRLPILLQKEKIKLSVELRGLTLQGGKNIFH